jgi:hypothetical protein
MIIPPVLVLKKKFPFAPKGELLKTQAREKLNKNDGANV